jgi:hypothetical protein
MSHNVQNGLDVIASRQLIAGESFALWDNDQKSVNNSESNIRIYFYEKT